MKGGENMKKQQQRDFQTEIRALLQKYPELRGKSLPQEVVDAAMEGMPLVEAYEQYRSAHLRRRSPVTGTAGYGAAEWEDDFLRGFNS